MSRWQAIVYVIIGALCYGVLSTFVKIVLQQGFTIQDISSSAIVIGCLLLWMITIPVLGDLKNHSYKTILIVTVVGSVWGLTEIFYMLTLDQTPASFAVILLFQFTWMTQIVHMIQTKTWLSTNRWVALGCILIGTYFASGTNMNEMLQTNLWGIMFGLLSALAYTLSIYVSAAVGTQMNQLVRSALMLTGQMVFVVLVFSPDLSFVQSLSEGLWLWAILLGLVGFVITTYTFNKAVPRIGVSLAGVLGSIELPTVIFFSAFILSESVTFLQWIGVGLILIGIVIAEYDGRALIEKYKVYLKSLHK